MIKMGKHKKDKRSYDSHKRKKGHRRSGDGQRSSMGSRRPGREQYPILSSVGGMKSIRSTRERRSGATTPSRTSRRERRSGATTPSGRSRGSTTPSGRSRGGTTPSGRPRGSSRNKRIQNTSRTPMGPQLRRRPSNRRQTSRHKESKSKDEDVDDRTTEAASGAGGKPKMLLAHDFPRLSNPDKCWQYWLERLDGRSVDLVIDQYAALGEKVRRDWTTRAFAANRRRNRYDGICQAFLTHSLTIVSPFQTLYAAITVEWCCRNRRTTSTPTGWMESAIREDTFALKVVLVLR